MSDRSQFTASEADLHNVISRNADGMIIIDRDGVVRLANPAAEELFGCTAGELPGAALDIRVEPGEATDMDIVRQDGTRAVGEVRMVEVEWEGRGAYLLSLRDISRRRQAERALRQSENRLRTLMEKMPDGVTVTVEGKVRYSNPALSQMTGYAPEELQGSSAVGLTHPEDRERAAMRIRDLVSGGTEYPSEYRVLGKDGGVVPVEVFSRCLDLDGELAILSVLRDRTERKRVEEALRESRERLRNLAIRQQVVREEERALIAREIHDELGQALTGVKMDLSWLQEKLPDGANLRERVGSMVAQLDTALEGVRNISSGLRPAVLDDLGLEAAIEWQAREFSKRVGMECGVRLEAGELTRDRGRDTAVFRILQESLTNVARHAAAARVDVDLRRAGADLVLTVRDDGRGIRPEEVSSSRSLGLIGMRERAGSFRGRVQVRRGAAGGTEVTLRMPVGEAGIGWPAGPAG
ncbi:MAG: PAS domain S-box protein [Planctomycetota bacterium]